MRTALSYTPRLSFGSRVWTFPSCTFFDSYQSLLFILFIYLIHLFLRRIRQFKATSNPRHELQSALPRVSTSSSSTSKPTPTRLIAIGPNGGKGMTCDLAFCSGCQWNQTTHQELILPYQPTASSPPRHIHFPPTPSQRPSLPELGNVGILSKMSLIS